MKTNRGFTIVELLIVIVVIGILATITIVSYTGINQKATAASQQSDLKNASNTLKLYYTDHETYPTSMTSTDGNVTYCPTPVDTRYCIKPTPGNTFSYSSSGPSTFNLTSTNTSSGAAYVITPVTAPTLVVGDPDWVTIGTQTWARANLNVGTMVNGSTNQTNNATAEKYCYNNQASNCDTYGGLYQWGEAMGYVETIGAQGLCPSGSHIPSLAEFSTLSTYLGGNLTSGGALKETGTSHWNSPNTSASNSSGFNGLPAGDTINNVWADINSYGHFWSSELYDGMGPEAELRILSYNSAEFQPSMAGQNFGFSVRCIKN
jgi:uncharacterized protein (TIGR02145 family)/prepilin-type N-terminal cleavage/methylation domain-containing protein